MKITVLVKLNEYERIDENELRKIQSKSKLETSNIEIGGSLPFLDTLISRDNNSFISSVYRKPTFTGLGTSFFSFWEFRFKIESTFTLLHRAYSIASFYQLFHDEVQYLISYFFNNGYPKHLILSCIKKFYVKNMTIHRTLPLIIVRNFSFLYHISENSPRNLK